MGGGYADNAMTNGSDNPEFEDRLDQANQEIYQSPLVARTKLNALLEALPDDVVEMRSRVTERLSIVERILGNFDLAARLGESAATGYQAINHPIGMARAWISLGNIYWSRGELERALGYYQQAYNVRRRKTDHSATAGALASIANIHVELGRFTEARNEYEQVLDLAHRASDKRIIARTENNLSECLLELGHPGTALNHARSALTVCRKLGDRSEEPNILINLGRILWKLKFLQEATEYAAEAIEISLKTGDRRIHAAGLTLLAHQYRSYQPRDSNRSPNDLEDQAFGIAQEIGAHGLIKTICKQAIGAANQANDPARTRRYQGRLDATQPL